MSTLTGSCQQRHLNCVHVWNNSRADCGLLFCQEDKEVGRAWHRAGKGLKWSLGLLRSHPLWQRDPTVTSPRLPQSVSEMPNPGLVDTAPIWQCK